MENPKEELFIEYTNTNDCTSMIYNSKEEPKQETFEEIADKYFPLTEKIGGEVYTFIAGANWQAERMYSEEEVRKIALDFFYHWWNSKGNNTEQGFDEWFKQFKNK